MRRAPLTRRPRPIAGAALGAVLVVVLSAAMIPFRADVATAAPALVLVLPVVAAAIVGGVAGAVTTAVATAVALNVVFIRPHGTFKIHAAEDVVALTVFSLVALAVGTLVGKEGERRQSADERAAELESLNAELRAMEEERARLAEEAERAAVLQHVDEQRAALLRSVSHDLRTPLATIRAVASDLLADPAYDAETRDDLLRLVAEEAERLDRLVANLLSMSRIEAGAFEPNLEAVPIDEVVDEAARRLAPLFRDRRLQVELPGDLPLVRGDYTQLGQVVVNVLENAARHAPPTTTVRVGGRVDGDVVDVWVDDEGAGLPPFERSRVFEPFRRGEGSRSSGVGLAICKAIVEAHGGSIAAEAAPSGGARFRFRLPVHR